MSTEFRADPNDPDFKKFQKKIMGTLLMGQALVMLTPTTEDDEYFDIIRDIISTNYERAYDAYRARHPKK